MTSLPASPLIEEATLPAWVMRSRPSPMEAILRLMSSGDVTPFGLGLPAPELFPTDVLQESANRTLRSAQLLQYGEPQRQLKSHVARIMSARGYPCSEDSILLTTGAQQALALVGRLLLEPNCSVVTEELLYPNFLHLMSPYSPRFRTVTTDLNTGIDLEALEDTLRSGPRPALLYVMSDGHNPLGVSMAPSKRRRLAELVRKYRLPVVEDDAYGFICYEKHREPPASVHEPNGMFYVGSFSKLLAPSLRVGWLVAPRQFIPILSSLKETADINTASLSQRIVCVCLDEMDLEAHVLRIVDEYRKRRDAMVNAIRRHFPPDTTCVAPSSGFFVWVTLSKDVDAVALCTRAIAEERIACFPGSSFAVVPHAGAARSLRLCFSNCDPERIEDGIRRLGILISKAAIP